MTKIIITMLIVSLIITLIVIIKQKEKILSCENSNSEQYYTIEMYDKNEFIASRNFNLNEKQFSLSNIFDYYPISIKIIKNK